MQKNGKKKLSWILWSILGIMLVFGMACVAGAINYVNRVPEVTARESLEVACGTTLSLNDLAEITCKGKYTVRLAIAETNVNSAKVLEEELKVEGDGTNQPVLYVGDEAGYLRLTINAVGSVAEYVSASVTIYVKPGEAEQAQNLPEKVILIKEQEP